MDYSDVEHFAVMVGGCEAINAGNYKDGDSIYAAAVLAMHVTPGVGDYAGCEGVGAAIKKGAAATLEWAKKLADAMIKWFANAFKSMRSGVKSLFTGDKEEQEKLAKELAGKLPAIVKRIKAAGEAAPEGVKADDLVKSCDAVLSACEKPEPASIKSTVDSLNTEIDRTEKDYLKWMNSFLPRKQGMPEKPYIDAVKKFNTFGKPINDLFILLGGKTVGGDKKDTK